MRRDHVADKDELGFGETSSEQRSRDRSHEGAEARGPQRERARGEPAETVSRVGILALDYKDGRDDYDHPDRS